MEGTSSSCSCSMDATTSSAAPPLIEPLDYSKAQAEFFGRPGNEDLKYKLSNSFVHAPVDRCNPLDRCLIGNQWYCSGYIVQRRRKSDELVFSQIIYIFRGESGDYYASLVDLEPVDGARADRFDAKLFRAKECQQNLHEVRGLTVIQGTPHEPGYFNPGGMAEDDEKALFLKQQDQQVAEEKRRNHSLIIPDSLLKNCHP